MKHNIGTLFRRFKEQSAELSHRITTPEEIRWGARFALNSVVEADLATHGWWQLPNRNRR